MSRKHKWILAALIVLSVVIIAQATSLQNLYLPLTYKNHLIATPTKTPTITPTPSTPCLSGKASGVCIIDIDYKPTTGGPLNEFISIKNLGSSSVDMQGWRISSDSGNKFDIETDFTLAGVSTVKVWTKVGINDSSNLYMMRTTEFWKDNQDCAYLKDDSDQRKTIDGVCYGMSGLFYIPPLREIP
jgi:hypothetical protein